MAEIAEKSPDGKKKFRPLVITMIESKEGVDPSSLRPSLVLPSVQPVSAPQRNEYLHSVATLVVEELDAAD